MKEIIWKTKENEQLIKAVLSLKNSNETECFLRDLMTAGEIREFASRLESARLLSRNVRYEDIVKNTGLSSTTVARISKWLNGPIGGYRLILPRLDKKPSNFTYHSYSSKLGKGLSLNT